MARRRGGLWPCAWGCVLSGMCTCVRVYVHDREERVHCALHVGARFSIPGILLTARAVQLLSEFCKPSEQTSCRQLSTLVSLDKVEGWG